MAFLQCEFFHVLSSRLSVQILCHNEDSWMAFLQCEFLSCSLKSSICTNFVSQCWQLNGFLEYECFQALSNVTFLLILCHNKDSWMAFLHYEFIHALKLSFCTNFVSQQGQLNGFSPVWILSYSLKLSFCRNLVSQCWQRLFSSMNSFMLSQVLLLY